MLNKKHTILISVIILSIISMTIAETIEENWNDFLHYVKIGRFNLAAGYGQAVLDEQPSPEQLLELAKSNELGYDILMRVHENKPDEQLAVITDKILEIIDQGRFIKRTSPSIINEEIIRLSSTARGRITAVKRLQDAGEYAIQFMINAMTDEQRKDEFANIVWALPQIGRDSIRPLTCATQASDAGLKAEIIKALGKVGYPQSLAYLKFIAEKEESQELRELALESIAQIDPAAVNIPSAQLFYVLAENYYYHAESLEPAEDADFANVWFWNDENQALDRVEVSRDYFYELMSMRCCEWALKADSAFGKAIGLWQAAFFKAESAGIDMPGYFGDAHATAMVYATTAGPEYLHQALARGIKDKNAFVSLGCVEALASIAGEKSLLYRIGPSQPLLAALSFDNRAVKYSAAIAIAQAGPTVDFAESKFIIANLADALAEPDDQDAADIQNNWVSESYAVRAANAMLNAAVTRNRIIELGMAQSALIDATKDPRDQIKVLAAKILAYLKGPEAQRAIADMALYEDNAMDVRIAGFESLGSSAKLNSNLLDEATIDTIYSLLSSTDTDPELRSAAARAFGSMNLPSRKVKDLILDQSKS